MGALDGLLVVALEQAVAAPLCTAKLADAGARVIKIERAEGDFARGYDDAVKGQASYFVWLNRGKESLTLDIKNPGDKALLERLIAKADVFVQNLAPGATTRAGIGAEELRKRHPSLITVDISGYGEEGPLAEMKAYDLLATLKPDGSAQPPTVYRALDFLTQAGLAHRVEAINAYMACIHQHDGDVAELFICEKCSKVLETHREVTSGEAPEGFRIERSVIEHYGRCADCR